MINKLISYSIEKPRVIITSFAILFILAVASLPFLTQVSDISQLISKKDSVIQLNKKMEAIFGSTRSSLITLKKSFSYEKLQEAKRVHELFLKEEGVTDVVSIFSEKYLASSDGSFEVENLITEIPKTNADISQLRKRLESFPLYKYSLFNNEDLNFFIQFKETISDETMADIVRNIIKTSKVKKEFTTSGWPQINNSIKGVMDRDLYILIPLVFIVITIIFYFLFRSLRGVIIPIITISVAIITAIGFMSLFGISLNVVSNSIPILLVAIGTSDGIHFMSKYYYYAPNFTNDHKQLIRTAAIFITPTILLTSLTTMGGFLANLFSPVSSISQFGLVTAIGVLVAGVASFLLIPSLLVKFAAPKENKQKKESSPIITTLTEKMYFTIRKYKFIIVTLVSFLFLAALYTTTKLQANYTLLGYFQPKSAVVVNAQKVSKSFGGLIEFNIVIDTGKQDGLINHNILNSFDQMIKKYKKKYPQDILFMTSLSDYIKNMSKAYNGDSEFYRIPKNNDEIAQYLEVYSWTGEVEDDLKYITDPDYKTGRIYGRFQLQENEKGLAVERSLSYYEKIVEEMSDDLKNSIASDVDIQLYGELPMWITTLKNIVTGQIHSVLIAMLIVFFMALPILKSLKLTFIALIPVLIAVVFNFAFMKLCNIQLDIATSLVSAMAIGIGIDDALHFLLTFKKIFQQEKSLELALKKTMVLTNNAILATSLTLTLGYSVFLFSSFKPINYFGLLNILTIILATLATMIVIPAFILITKPKK